MTPEHPVLSRLDDVSEGDVQVELAAVREERERLETKEQILQALLNLVRQRDGDKSSGSGSIPSSQPQEDPSPAEEPRVPAKTPQKGNRRRIIEIMSSDRGRSWRAPEIHDALTARGVDIRRETVRMTLRRMVDANQLTKHETGEFRLPPGNEVAT